MKLIESTVGYFIVEDDYLDLTFNSEFLIFDAKKLPDNVSGIKVGDLVKLNPTSTVHAYMINLRTDAIYRVEKIDVFKNQLKIKGDGIFHASHFEVVKIHGE